MRIPSQFDEDNLFRRRNRRHESAQSYRQLLRLLIGLALVIVVMRQAANPAIYQTFFGDPVPATHVASHPGQDTWGVGVGLPDDGFKDEIGPEDREVANWLTARLPPADQREWVVALARWQTGRPLAQLPSSLDLVMEQLASLEHISDQQRLAWQVMFDSLQGSGAESEGASATPPTSLDRPRIAAFLAALDDAAAARVVDGSVWRSGDFDLFYRYLDQAGGLSGQGVAASGVLPLLQQPDVFRNQLVRTSGTVARTERIEAEANPYGISHYWQLWIRPADGADRPLVAIVPSVPALIESVGPDWIVDDGPRVTIVGWFFKRLAYQSALGADLAPVVVGRIVYAPVTAADVTAETQTGNGNPSGTATSTGLWITLAVACLTGFGLAVITMWRTSVMAQRARLLRNEHRRQPDDFLQALEHRADGPADQREPGSVREASE